MKYRKLGRTGLKISEIGFGAWAIGIEEWGYQEDKDSIAALNRALDLGCNFFDTALAYGNGHSEKLIGTVLRERKVLDDVIIATKVPPKNEIWSPPLKQSMREAFPSNWIIECCDRSLENLGRDYIDLLQLHTWNKSWDNEMEWYKTLMKLKEDDKIRYFGISVSATRPNEANKHVTEERIDSIQVVYNILDQSPEKELFPLAKKHNIGIITRQPLAAGGLTGKFTKHTKFPKGDWRGYMRNRVWLEKIVEQVELVNEIISDNMEMYEAAIKFCLANPVISTTIPGVRNVKQAEMNFRTSDEKKLNEKQLHQLKQLWISGKIGGIIFA